MLQWIYIAGMSILAYQNYRDYLKDSLSRKAKANPAYSLRAMAKQLGIAPSYFSSILKGTKNLSPERALAIAAKVPLNEREKEYFCLLVQIESTSSPLLKESFLTRARAVNPLAAVHDLSLDHFKVISDWFHFAMLAATEVPKIETTPEGFSQALGISRMEAGLALDRLQRLEMIEKNSSGRLRKTASNPRVVSPSPNKALRNYHRQTLQKAIDSLETQTPQEKVIGSETLAIDSSQLEDFRKLTDKFFDAAVELAKKAKRKDQVYHLGVQFFNFTQQKGNRK